MGPCSSLLRRSSFQSHVNHIPAANVYSPNKILLREIGFVQLDWVHLVWPQKADLSGGCKKYISLGCLAQKADRSLLVGLCFQTCIGYKCAALAWRTGVFGGFPKDVFKQVQPRQHHPHPNPAERQSTSDAEAVT